MSTEFQLHVQGLRYRDEDNRAYCLCGRSGNKSETYSHMIAMQYDRGIVKEKMEVSQEHRDSCSCRSIEKYKELGEKNLFSILLNHSKSHIIPDWLCVHSTIQSLRKL